MSMKVYLNTDLEGICCFVDWEEAQFTTGRGIEYTKRFLTAEVNAAIEGILLADAEAEIVVQDGHGGGYWGPNLIAEELNPRAEMIFGKRGVEIAGLDESFDLMVCVGVHSMAGTKHGTMNHTINHNQIQNFWINGVKVGEIGIWAAIGGQYGVPIGMLSGDYWAIEEAKALLDDFGGIEGVAVKKGINLYTAQCMHPAKARELIREAARAAVAGRARFRPYNVASPVEIAIEYTNTQFADRGEFHLGAERLDGRTVRFRGEDFICVLNRATA